MRKKLLFLVVILFVLAGVVYALRVNILQACSGFLMHEDELQPVEVLFVLSGGSYDRGNEAAKLFHQGCCKQIVCTGGNPYIELKVFNIDTLESDMAVANLKRLGVPDSCIVHIRYGTSTREESDTIIAWCKDQKLQKAIVLSSRLHTGRVNSSLRPAMKASGIEFMLHGAPSSRFDEDHWWYSEAGLIAVNNEWIKTMLYWLKY